MTHSPPLSPQLLLWAYRRGMFPMARSSAGPIDWYSPEIRSILPLDGLRFSRSLLKRIRLGEFRITRDAAFRQVISCCAQPRREEAETWINEEIINAYCALHEIGHAHSVEAWLDVAEGQTPDADAAQGDTQVADDAKQNGAILVGGLYGVTIGGAFFGESMFSRRTDASKVCLYHLAEHLHQRGYTLLDSQYTNPHIAQFGSIEIPQQAYIERLNEALAIDITW